MTHHILIQDIFLQPGFIQPCHEPYLKQWREEAIQRADVGDVAASVCLQGTLIDLVLFGKPSHDWLGIMDEYLSDEDVPLAYSEVFGKRLHKFDGQYKQSTIHAIHTHWWIECLNTKDVDHQRFAKLVLSKKQDDGLIYDRDVSETILRHRMKAELTYSMAMAVEMFRAANILTKPLALELATNIVAPKKCPPSGYMSMEYFRLKALKCLEHEAQFPIGIDEHIESCTYGLPVGWCDFAMKSKVDAYMGTAKRTGRDKPIHTPLIACHVASLLEQVTDKNKRAAFENRLHEYACFLKKNPFDIPSFQMRDVPIPFGADKTPIEIICASYLIAKCQSN
jgi:hypothetical protein